jgi:hypothetical protein
VKDEPIARLPDERVHPPESTLARPAGIGRNVTGP